MRWEQTKKPGFSECIFMVKGLNPISYINWTLDKISTQNENVIYHTDLIT
ncbi:Uncharacterized protein dnm_017700 [Desulfonema magnum]|uniref:Uncharacterized protein n=1 Tax=Desulfonema magnum TaxID=45655 RepID=A0A975BHW3_9BACT|nr:Uncharacterized protein dnm_017700 [Desulfonema magnum]